MNVAILGATGAVGREMMKILAERSFPVEELRPPPAPPGKSCSGRAGS